MKNGSYEFMLNCFCSNGFSELQNVNRKYFGIAASFYQIIGVDTWVQLRRGVTSGFSEGHSSSIIAIIISRGF